MNAHVVGDLNRDVNDGNDRLPGVGRNFSIGHNRSALFDATIEGDGEMEFEPAGGIVHPVQSGQQAVEVTEDGFQPAAASFVLQDTELNNHWYRAQFRVNSGFLQPNNA